mgnify:CR=1 FL=1
MPIPQSFCDRYLLIIIEDIKIILKGLFNRKEEQRKYKIKISKIYTILAWLMGQDCLWKMKITR